MVREQEHESVLVQFHIGTVSVDTKMKNYNNSSTIKIFFNVKRCEETRGAICLTTLDFIGNGSTLKLPQLVTAILLCMLNIGHASLVFHLLRKLKRSEGSTFGIVLVTLLFILRIATTTTEQM